MEIQHYRHLAEGTIRLVGNSCQIKENVSGLSGREKNHIRLYNLHHDKRHYVKKNTPPKRETNDIKGFSKKVQTSDAKKSQQSGSSKQKQSVLYYVNLPQEIP